MQDDKFNINEPDVFSESIRQKLENFEIPVDAACWNEIESRLTPKQKKRIVPFWWWLSGGAVALLALVFTIGKGNESTNFASKTTQQKSIQKETVSEPQNTISKELAISTETSNLKESKTTHNQATKQTKDNNQSTSGQSIQSVTVFTDSITKNGTETTTNNALAANTGANSVIKNDSAKETPEKRILPERLMAKDETNDKAPRPIEKQKNNEGWLLAAAFGPSGASPMMGSPKDFLSLSNGEMNLADVETKYYSVMAPTDFTEKTYNPALSFGLTVQKQIVKGLNIESGLVYTNLSSTFQTTGVFTNDATLTLHYLGIPVNMIARLWRSNKWELYASGGGMLEKGLRSVYVQHQNMGNQIITTTANTKIDGLQWSVNSGLGLTYKIQPKLGLYFEPKLSYFFENNQPVSTRTDQPVSFGLSFGLRFEL